MPSYILWFEGISTLLFPPQFAQGNSMRFNDFFICQVKDATWEFIKGNICSGNIFYWVYTVYVTYFNLFALDHNHLTVSFKQNALQARGITAVQPVFFFFFSKIKIGAARLLSVTGIASKSPFLFVNRTSVRYVWRAGAKAIRYSVNSLWSYNTLKLKSCKTHASC